jgi:molecular chaperone GrpE
MNRDEIVRRFEIMLDEALASEEPPGGIEAELLSLAASNGEEVDRHCDSYALWSAMTALTQEIRLQGRAFKELTESVGSQTERISAEIRTAYEMRERDLQRQADHRARREILGALIDMRDRLARGLETALASRSEPRKTGWLDGLMGRSPDASAEGIAAALLKGYRLGLERLDALLVEFNATEIPCRGQVFDARRMNAIDLEESEAVPDGTVLEVYRSGYEWNGEVFRPAQVKVSRAPAKVQQV